MVGVFAEIYFAVSKINETRRSQVTNTVNGKKTVTTGCIKERCLWQQFAIPCRKSRVWGRANKELYDDDDDRVDHNHGENDEG